MKTTETQLINKFINLKAWGNDENFNAEDWKYYIEVARLVQKTDSGLVERSLGDFIVQFKSEVFNGTESESKLFLLMRVVFELPEKENVEKRKSFKGWLNWPVPDHEKNVNLSWPVTWVNNYPKLLDSYKGSMGLPYNAVDEYLYFHQHFKYRKFTNEM